MKADLSAGQLNSHQAADVMAYINGAKQNPAQKTDPKSYVEAVTRLTDPDNPLTREEFLKQVSSGEWKFDPHVYGQFLTNINRTDTKMDKTFDSVYKARLGYWRTQFGLDPKGEAVMTALGQAQAAKDANELGSTADEINGKINEIFKPHFQDYMKEQSLGEFKPKPKPVQPGLWQRYGPSSWGTGGGAAPAPSAPPVNIQNDKGWMNPGLQGSK